MRNPSVLRRGLCVAALSVCALVPADGWAAPDAPAANALAPGAIIWQRQFGNSLSQGISKLAVDASNNVIAYGTTAGVLSGTSAGGTDVFLTKYNSAGTRLWIKQLGHAQNDQAIGMGIGGAGDIFIAGSIATATPQWFLARYSSAGTLLWKKIFTTPRPVAIAVTPTNQIGALTPPPNPATDSYTSRLEFYSSSGTLLWRRSIDLMDAYALASDNAGYLIVAGQDGVHAAAGGKYSSSGTQMWWRIGYDLYMDFSAVVDIAVDPANNILMALGYTGAFDDPDWRSYNVILKLAPDGRTTASQQVRDPWSGSGLVIASNPSGEPVTAGSRTMYSQTGVDGLVTAFTSGAAVRWRAPYGTTGTDYANDVAVDGAGNIYIGGWTNGALGGTALGGGDAYLLKLRPY